MNNRQRMRPAALAMLVGALTLAMTACVGIPTSGPVISGPEVSERDLDPFVVVLDGPVADADQESILSGFIAAYSASGDYEVARQFLTREFAKEWDPRASVLLRTGNPHFDRVNPTTMDYDIVTTAAVDQDGVYSYFAPAPQTLSYEFARVDGQWRISEAPDGIVLSAGTFDELFSEHALYFLDPTRQTLVPDLRWFPGGTAATRIVSALLGGPPAWLQGAVGTAFPDGTQLTSPKRVAVESDVAVVDLTAEALAGNKVQRQLMRAQLEASLRNVGSISSVEIAVDGTPLSIPPLGANSLQPRPQVDGRMLVLKDGEFGYLANNRIATIDDLSAKIVATEPIDATLGANDTMAATLGNGGVYLARSTVDDPVLIDSRPGLIAPSLDGYGYLWTAQRADPTSIRVFDLDGNGFDVQTTLPRGAEIVSLTVSRDGTRIAILLETDAGPRLVVTAIIRDPNRDQVPVSLGEPKVDVTTGSGTAIDATWADELTVATLTAAEGETEVNVFQVGGRRSSLGSPGDAVAIVGSNSESGLRVLGADGVVAVRRGSSWQSGPQVEFIATQR